ncbi:beta-D-glucosyl crocetin beta-1,6-glucosyltransferase-like [Coffea arabica]|uniref:Glycosyltransferase n=1 Tax=Coffea arabica TaxID=13443 RepID=A0A6P6TFT2_COFAR|nr:beta-D-glucosyl crocetin beta-1,6-glucosyltransferase-like [Coffea arabica]
MEANTTENAGNNSVRVLMLPMLGHGHISPFLQLAKKLTERGIHIYLCSTPINLNSISKKITGKYSESIQLVEFHLQELPELPSRYHTTDGLPSHLLPIFFNSLKLSNPEIHNIIESLKPDLVIYDKAFARFSVSPLYTFPSVWLHIVSAASLSYTFHLTSNSGTEYPFPSIYLRDFELRRLLTTIGRNALDPCEDSPIPLLVNTCRAMEGKYLDHHASSTNLKVLPVGPLIPSSPNSTGESGDDDIELMNWLGQKSEHSTVFASFGTMYFLSKEEIQEIAFGLELSNVNFIWALGSPKGEQRRLDEILPEGFLERVKDKGRIVQGWVPQAKILGHSSIGGLLSHCGWTSTSEGIEFGVPTMAMPMAFEQPITGRVLVENGVAIEVMRDENGRLQREEIARVIKDVVFGGAGETMRQKIKDLRKKIKSEEKENLDGLLTLIIQLSNKNSSHGINIARA